MYQIQSLKKLCRIFLTCPGWNGRIVSALAGVELMKQETPTMEDQLMSLFTQDSDSFVHAEIPHNAPGGLFGNERASAEGLTVRDLSVEKRDHRSAPP